MIRSRFVLSCSWDPALLTLDLPPHKKKNKPSRSAKISSFFFCAGSFKGRTGSVPSSSGSANLNVPLWCCQVLKNPHASLHQFLQRKNKLHLIFKKSTESTSHYHNTKDPIQTPKWREKSRKKQHLMPGQFGNKIMPYLRTHLLKKEHECDVIYQPLVAGWRIPADHPNVCLP